MQMPLPTIACDSQLFDSHWPSLLQVPPDFVLLLSFCSQVRRHRLQPTVAFEVWQSASALHSGLHELFEPSLSHAWPERQPPAPLHSLRQNVPSSSLTQVLFASQPVETPLLSRLHEPEKVQ